MSAFTILLPSQHFFEFESLKTPFNRPAITALFVEEEALDNGLQPEQRPSCIECLKQNPSTQKCANRIQLLSETVSYGAPLTAKGTDADGKELTLALVYDKQ
jgi:hypothetical protein